MPRRREVFDGNCRELFVRKLCSIMEQIVNHVCAYMDIFHHWDTVL